MNLEKVRSFYQITEFYFTKFVGAFLQCCCLLFCFVGHQRQQSCCDNEAWYYGLGMAFLAIAAPALPGVFGVTSLFLRYSQQDFCISMNFVSFGCCLFELDLNYVIAVGVYLPCGFLVSPIKLESLKYLYMCSYKLYCNIYLNGLLITSLTHS